MSLGGKMSTFNLTSVPGFQCFGFVTCILSNVVPSEVASPSAEKCVIQLKLPRNHLKIRNQSFVGLLAHLPGLKGIHAKVLVEAIVAIGILHFSRLNDQ
jgi:hypothetical protein